MDTNRRWQAITTAPFGRDLELAVIEGDDVHRLVFPCRRILSGWTNTITQAPVHVNPTHWRPWEEKTD
ncbi:hypothetical protein [Bradyrhizobium sp. dw_78]|uniref:hypothetical protein n=1 Tax=Bradyrhizobium sp. dw_78 TaxID=2719793 RepID=UPI001BD4D787|nr:hypothetical protein [Bradyrhizobium sp. dw_78]